MSTNNHHDASKERFWRQLMRQWQCSGLTARAFCEEQGLSEPSFYGWRRTSKRATPPRPPSFPFVSWPNQGTMPSSKTPVPDWNRYRPWSCSASGRASMALLCTFARPA